MKSRGSMVFWGRLRGVVCAVVAVTLLAVAGMAQASVVTYDVVSSGGDGPVDAMAVITTNNGSINVALTSLEQNPTAAGQLVSSLEFNVTSGVSSPGSLSTATGLTSTISAGGSYTTGVSTSLNRWISNSSVTATSTGATVSLLAIGGGAPNQMIIGPDSAGGFSGAGLYSNANPSITNNHNPSVLGTATFTITDANVTTASTISNVEFDFGTGPDFSRDGTLVPNTTPEPATLVIWSLLGGLAIGLGWWRKRKAA